MSRHQHDALAGLLGLSIGKAVSVPAGVKENGRISVLARYSRRPSVLKARYKGKTIKGRVLRDGSISLDGKTYLSPSLAGAAACKRRTCNGWTFWTYERAPGDWVLLDELRKK